MPGYRFSAGRVGTGLTTIVRAEAPLVVTSVVICNTDTSNRDVDLRHVPADEDASDDHAIFHLLVVRANTTQTLEVPIYLQVGDALQAYASTADVVAVHAYALDYDSYLEAGGGR